MFHTTGHTHREKRGTFGYSRESVWGQNTAVGGRYLERQMQQPARNHGDTYRMCLSP